MPPTRLWLIDAVRVPRVRRAMPVNLPTSSCQADAARGVKCPRPRELDEAEFRRHVLAGADITDLRLAERAVALGIEFPPSTRPSVDQARNGSAAGGPVSQQHGRTASTSSDGTTATGLTSQTSRHSTVIPATLTETPRRRSKSLGFSQYDKYLSQVRPTLDQPRFRPRSSALKLDRSASLLLGRGSTRLSVREIRRNITDRLRGRGGVSSLTVV